MADGQVTRNNEIVKPNVRKVRSMIDGTVIGGFAGAVTGKLYQHSIWSLCARPGHLDAMVHSRDFAFCFCRRHSRCVYAL